MGTKFTKGEWKIDADRYDLEDTIITDKGVRIAEVKSFGEGFNDAPCEERAANSKLIAAAPEMFEALSNAVRFIRNCPGLKEDRLPKGLEKWEAILNKATE